MQKILILITKSNWGGAQRYVYDLATSLPKDNYDVEVMAGSSGILIDKLKSVHITANGNLTIGRDVSLTEDIKAFFNLISILRSKKPDILHVNSSKIGGLGALAGRLTGVPKIVFTVHGWAFNENRNYLSKILIKLSYWITLMLSHSVIAVSESVRQQAGNWPFVFKKISVVYNGIRPEAIFSKTNARSELAKIFPQLKEIFQGTEYKKLLLIGTVAELHHIKGHEYALRAVRELIESNKTKNPEMQIVYLIAGDGEDYEKLQKTIDDLDIQKNVVLLGHVTDASHYLKAFDIFLLASLSEGLAYVLLEAGLAGLPVVATTVGGIPEVIDDMESGVLIQPRKPKEIQHALEFYLTHKKTQKEYGLKLQKNIMDRFSIEKMVNETIKIYESRGQ
jgi:glycosyltransferase involved in cell wall biosynthesis